MLSIESLVCQNLSRNWSLKWILYEIQPAGLEPVDRKAVQSTSTPAADESKGKISGLIDKVKSLF